MEPSGSLARNYCGNRRANMGRSFAFRYAGRSLSIRVHAIDEGWELWVAEGERRLALGGRLSVDEAVEAWRNGEDRIQSLVEEVKSHILTAKLPIDATY
jgi:hypothetical protein